MRGRVISYSCHVPWRRSDAAGVDDVLRNSSLEAKNLDLCKLMAKPALLKRSKNFAQVLAVLLFGP